MTTIRIAFDDNLGLPSGFVDALDATVRAHGASGCEAVSFHDVGAMLGAFDRREVAIAFAPAGSLPYVASAFDVIAEASFGPEHETALRSALRVRASDGAVTLDDIATRKIGCVNRYCTTSYWAPMILLERESPGMSRAPLDFHEAAGFDDMLRAVVDGRTDGAMVWDAVALRDAEAANKTQASVVHDDLPCPLLIANEALVGDIRTAVAAFATAYRSDDPAAFFNGFTVPNAERIERFRAGMARAQAAFGLS